MKNNTKSTDRILCSGECYRLYAHIYVKATKGSWGASTAGTTAKKHNIYIYINLFIYTYMNYM